jgi:hypothetical protein
MTYRFLDQDWSGRMPKLGWDAPERAGLDAVVANTIDLEFPTLHPIPNPYWHLKCCDSLDLLRTDPSAANYELDNAVQKVNAQATKAVQNGASGLVYCLFGASPNEASPMVYGGHFLELDREILTGIETFCLLFAVGRVGVYLDVLSDLPAAAFGWDAESSGIPAMQVRRSRSGLLASTDPASDILLISRHASITDHLENQRF